MLPSLLQHTKRDLFPGVRCATLVSLVCALVPSVTGWAQSDVYRRCDSLFNDIYFLRLDRKAAVRAFTKILPDLRTRTAKDIPRPAPRDSWVFPVKGYAASAIGGRGDEGYRGAAAYDFFAGNAHGGHPAFDIFIRDRNRDCIDDKTQQPVPVISISSGVVVCVNPTWAPDSMDAVRGQVIRGGLYVWVYDPASDGLFYYAHLRNVSCLVGQIVKPGDTLGEVGRTGKNAFPPRSPTHLHFMCLSLANGLPRPVNVYDDLLRASRKK
ncbi:MAG: M23 family metallopeptidase [Bacteroidota bacterium]|nr:M23 family metallopeptidase [Bacteroidota bacterium]